MGKLSLTPDPRSGLFALSALGVIRPEARETGTFDPWAHFEMIVDTGSTSTSVSETVARELGYNPQGLATERTGGIGGIVGTPVIPDLDLLVIADGGIPTRVPLAKVSILMPVREKVTQKSGIMKRVGERRMDPPCLFGLNALAALHATLTVRAEEREAWIEW